jgi:vacuolar protein sorting-associated protein 13A/C
MYWVVGADGRSVSAKQALSPGHENGLPQLISAAILATPVVDTPSKTLVRGNSLLVLPRKRVDRSAVARQLKSSARPQLHATIQGFSDVVITNFDQTGKFAIPLGSGNGRNLVYEIQNRFGAKVIAFTSPVLIKNTTSYGLQIGWEKSGTEHDQQRRLFVLPIVESGKTIPVPLEMVFDGSLRFRPAVSILPISDETAEQARMGVGSGGDTQRAKDNPYRWSSVKCECNSLKVGTRVVPCLAKASESQPFGYVAHVEHASTEGGIHSRDQLVLKVCPPIVIENLLAHKMKYKLFDKVTGELVYQGAINKGQRADIHTVKHQQELTMQIKLHGYGWTERELIVSAGKFLANRFVLREDASADRTLQLNLDNVLSHDGIRTISVYCLFWIVNKTGLPLGVTSRTTRSRSSADAAEEASDPDRVVLYDGEVRDWFYCDLLDESPQMYYPASYQSGKFYFRLGPSSWSKGINLNTQNANTVLEVEEKRGVGVSVGRQRLFEVALSIYPAQNKFWKTRIITLAPRYVVHNKTQHTVFFRQKGSDFISSLLPQEKIPFQWPDKSKEKRVRIRLNVPHCSWSGEIDMADIDRYPLRLYNSKTGRIYIVRVRLNLFVDQGISVLSLEDEQMQRPLYRVDNLTHEQILLKQKEVGLPEVIPPRSRHAWSWHEPTKTYLVEAQFSNKSADSIVLSFAKVKSYAPIKFKNADGKTVTIRPEMRTDKFTRVLVFVPILPRRLQKRAFVASGLPRQIRTPSSSQQNLTLPSPKQGPSQIPSSSSQDSASESVSGGSKRNLSPKPEEVSAAAVDVLEESKEKWKLELRFDRVGISVVDEKNEELVYCTIDELAVEYVLTAAKQSIELLIRDCQIDNQLSSTYFPVLLYSPVREPPNFFKLAIIKSVEPKDVDYYNYVSVLCRELFLQLDEEIVIKLLGFIDVTLESFEDTSGDAVGHKLFVF